MEEFEKHAASIKGLDEAYLMDIFLNGLKEGIEAKLRLFKPLIGNDEAVPVN